jgi:hypothetical protein
MTLGGLLTMLASVAPMSDAPAALPPFILNAAELELALAARQPPPEPQQSPERKRRLIFPGEEDLLQGERRRPDAVPDDLRDREVQNNPGAIRSPPPEAFPRDHIAIPDRWRLVESLGVREDYLDPYNQNTLKGDRPICSPAAPIRRTRTRSAAASSGNSGLAVTTGSSSAARSPTRWSSRAPFRSRRRADHRSTRQCRRLRHQS